ncbi:PucR family transcriptional regulator ligand-binding domain-containing protein [Ruminococcaceae bacterium OttesenSCG-928-A11]|nr:PucR family transcriptional regulator ligand-binding domain-containing protein [Ruminococcaceae bacterium OttesenSCG-928-A11]
MAISTSDLLKVPYFAPVMVVAGAKGLDKPVNGAGILDYEYDRDYIMNEQVFLKDSLLVSSLLFAKDDPDALIGALRELIPLGVTGLAYKTAIFEDLPAEVLELADRHNFPILKFGMELFVEEFIFNVMENIRLEHQIVEKEKLLDDLIEGRTPKTELHRVAKQINPYLDRYVYTAYFDQREKMDFPFFETVHRGPTGIKRIDDGTTVCRYQNGFFILISDHHSDEKRYAARLEDIMAYLAPKKNSCRVGKGQMNRCPEELALCFQQAWYASLCARVTGAPAVDYAEMGLYQILVPHARSPHLMCFAGQFLAPILEDTSETAQDLFKTAVAYVLSEGDITKTAERAYCHKNTVRYRMNKLHERLAPGSREDTFFEQLSSAVRIHLLNNL